MLGVVLYHAGISWLPAGFLGVDSFFVLSGFLITSLLLGEVRHSGSIELALFWARRARRLLPALFVVVSFCAIFVWVGATAGTYPGFRLDAFSTLLYVANWHFILSGANYFVVTSAPSPLTHTWSLAIEEQFYVVWPLLVLGLTKLGRGTKTLLLLSILGAAASTIWMAVRHAQGASLTRLYYGTDTHAMGMLVGAALASTLALVAARRRAGGRLPRGRAAELRGGDPGWAVTSLAGRRLLGLLGVAALVGSGLLWCLVDFSGPFLYTGGFLLMALLTAVVILSAVCHQRGIVALLLSLAPLVFLGRISYGVYLWHFPLFAWLDGPRTGLNGLSLLALRLGVTLVVSVLSFFLIERPIRHGGLLRGWKGASATAASLLVTVSLVVGATAGAALTGIPSSGFSTTSGSLVNPVRVLLLGDSTALTLGFPLSKERFVRRYDVVLDDQGAIGCGLLTIDANINRGVTLPSPDPCSTSPAPGTTSVQEQWRSLVRSFHPDVVALLAGRWEVHDLIQNGQVISIEQPSFQAQVRQRLEEAITIFTEHGAHVVLYTQACASSGTQADGQPFPEDSPTRLAIYNNIVREVAAAHKSNVSVFDLGRLVCPRGIFHATIKGMPVRQADGVHFAIDGGEFFGPRLWPALVTSGEAARNARRSARSR